MPAPPLRDPREAAASRQVLAIFALGLAVSAVMVARSQVGGDQLNLLARGWMLAAQGRWISYGNPMSTGGNAPGGITSLLVGLPLLVWRDFRAPSLVVLAFHVLAFAVLDRALARILSPRERALFALLYWLSPWRIYFSGFLWNPNYLYLFGALHLSTALVQRERPRFWASFVHAAALVLAFQIHASFLLLFVASALLFWRGYFKVHWGGLIAGGALAAIPLIPWALELAANPAIAAAGKGFLGRGLLFVFPLVRGILYLLRYGALSLAGRMGRFDFTAIAGVAVDRWLRPLGFVVTQVIGPLSVLLPMWAAVRLWRRVRHRWARRLPAAASGREWLRGYVVWCFAAALIVYSLSPTTLMSWQGLILVHAAVIPAVLLLGALLRGRLARRVRWGVAAWGALEVLLAVAMAFGSPHYRCGGRSEMRLALRYDHPMLHDLRIVETCPMPLGVPDGWWPDVLPAPQGRSSRTPL